MKSPDGHGNFSLIFSYYIVTLSKESKTFPDSYSLIYLYLFEGSFKKLIIFLINNYKLNNLLRYRIKAKLLLL